MTLYRDRSSLKNLGLTLSEGKALVTSVQKKLLSCQTADYMREASCCKDCGKQRKIKGHHNIKYRTVYGEYCFDSPRLYECACQDRKAKSTSPLTKLLGSRISPELSYIEAKWASLLSYGLSTKLLNDFLPIDLKTSSIYDNSIHVASKLEQEMAEEKYTYINTCPAEWEQLPKPDLPMTVGIDGGYVKGREDKNRKAGCFEIIVGKSLQDNKPCKRFSFVTQYDDKPKRRLHDMSEKQGLQLNQAITFLSDGGDNVRDLQTMLSPQAEYLLDWFHITIRITVLKNMAVNPFKDKSLDFHKEMASIKHYLWHGNVYQALQQLSYLVDEVDIYCEDHPKIYATLSKTLEEFQTYIELNQQYITNYGERYRYGEKISTGFVESTVNELISHRMAKKQQMRWTKKGAHLLLQLRVKTLNDELKETFERWHTDVDMTECNNDQILYQAEAA